MNNSFEPSSIEKRRRKIQPNIKEIFGNWNRVLKEIISTFNQDHLEDDNGYMEKALQSLGQLLTCGFD